MSIKLSQFGLELSPAACRENVAQLVERAAAAGTRVEIDMERSDSTERTLDVVREMHGRFRAVRAVIQAYLHRSEDDIGEAERGGDSGARCARGRTKSHRRWRLRKKVKSTPITSD